MILENDILRVEIDDTYPIIRSTLHKPTGTIVPGYNSQWDLNIEINEEPSFPSVRKLHSERMSDNTYAVTIRNIRLTFSISLNDNEIIWRLDDVQDHSEELRTLYIPFFSPVRCGPDWKYRRYRYHQRPWDLDCARGIWDMNINEGLVGAAIPDQSAPADTYACLWNDKVCITAWSSFLLKPLELDMHEGDAPNRTEYATLQPGTYHYRVGDKIMDPLEFRVAFMEDVNGDGKADYMDGYYWTRRQLPDPNPIYAESVMYKIFCANRYGVYCTFDQALEIIKRVHLISDGMPQIVYLVGWQYGGHDTGYPALDKINEDLGTREDLLRIVEEAKNYNAVVSYHINIDDAYMDSPEWDPDIMCKDPSGEVYPWEVFDERQAYHINHTKDVESGKIFKRLDAMLDLVPVEKSIHIDALRITNESWEGDRYIGMVEELELGLKPILAYFKEKGIDVSTEAIDRFPAELTGLFSCTWHMWDPRTQFGKLLGGGRGETILAYALGASINTDLRPEFTFERIADMIYLGTRLYQLYLTQELMDLRWEGERIYLNFGDNRITNVDGNAQTMHTQWGDIEVARDFDRFIPVDDNTICAYSRTGGEQEWTLPESWADAAITAVTITPGGVVDGPEMSVEGRRVRFSLEARRPLKLTRR